MSLKSIKVSFLIITVFLVGILMFAWLGIFNVAANEKHWDITTSFLEFVRDSSISLRSKSIPVPDLTSRDRITRAAANYAAMCAQCHLAPGLENSELYEGLYPKPPVFNNLENITRQPKEIFWIIKNGLKMTGMPAWGNYNSDEQIWDLVALITSLNRIKPEQYTKFVDAGEHTHNKGGHKDETHSQKSVEPNSSNSHNHGNHKH